MSSTASTERLTTLIAERHRTLSRLRNVSAKQFQVLQRQSLNELHGLLAAKQTLIEDLVRLDQEIDPFRDEDPERRVWANPEQREACRQLVAECARWLAEVKELEAGAERLARQQLDETSKSMEQSVDRNRAVSAYRRIDTPLPGASLIQEG